MAGTVWITGIVCNLDSYISVILQPWWMVDGFFTAWWIPCNDGFFSALSWYSFPTVPSLAFQTVTMTFRSRVSRDYFHIKAAPETPQQSKFAVPLFFVMVSARF